MRRNSQGKDWHFFLFCLHNQHPFAGAHAMKNVVVLFVCVCVLKFRRVKKKKTVPASLREFNYVMQRSSRFMTASKPLSRSQWSWLRRKMLSRTEVGGSLEKHSHLYTRDKHQWRDIILTANEGFLSWRLNSTSFHFFFLLFSSPSPVLCDLGENVIDEYCSAKGKPAKGG